MGKVTNEKGIDVFTCNIYRYENLVISIAPYRLLIDIDSPHLLQEFPGFLAAVDVALEEWLAVWLLRVELASCLA